MPTYEDSPLVRQPHQQRSREALAKIIRSAELLLEAKGYDGFSMGALAEWAGIPVGNIYRRFRGKAELLQMIKEKATDRVERTVLDHLARGNFPDIDSVVHRVMDAVVMAFANDENLHHILFVDGVHDPSINQVGWNGRDRVFGHYRNALLPLLGRLPDPEAEVLAQVSFNIIAEAIVGKARTDNPILNAMSWSTLSAEFSAAAIAYLNARTVAAGKDLPR